MNSILRNEQAVAEISALGAEVISLRSLAQDCEYIWNGDETYWTGHSPVLFPIIGAVRGGQYQTDGQTYSLGNHGFARRKEFELVENSDTQAVYQLHYDEPTLSVYPFKFRLSITYTLNGNALNIKYRVDNLDDQEIFFQLGTHPAFNCPLDDKGELSDYYLEFEQAETLERLFIDSSSNLIVSGQSEGILNGDTLLPLNHQMFEQGALVFKNVVSNRVALKSKTTDKHVVVSYDNLPDLGIWQPLNAPFICIEPWHGTADEDSFSGELKDKDHIISLSPGSSFDCTLVIEIH